MVNATLNVRIQTVLVAQREFVFCVNLIILHVTVLLKFVILDIMNRIQNVTIVHNLVQLVQVNHNAKLALIIIMKITQYVNHVFHHVKHVKIKLYVLLV